jgi:hypothetical protein
VRPGATYRSFPKENVQDFPPKSVEKNLTKNSSIIEKKLDMLSKIGRKIGISSISGLSALAASTSLKSKQATFVLFVSRMVTGNVISLASNVHQCRATLLGLQVSWL